MNKIPGGGSVFLCFKSPLTSTWKDSIEKITITIVNNSAKWINEVDVDNYEQYHQIENINEQVQIVLHNVQPKISDLIILTVNPVPWRLWRPRRIDPDRYLYYNSKEDVFSSGKEVEIGVFRYIESYYNRIRRWSYLGNRLPMQRTIKAA